MPLVASASSLLFSGGCESCLGDCEAERDVALRWVASDQTASQAHLGAVFPVLSEGVHQLLHRNGLLLTWMLRQTPQVEQVSVCTQHPPDLQGLREAIAMWPRSIFVP